MAMGRTCGSIIFIIIVIVIKFTCSFLHESSNGRNQWLVDHASVGLLVWGCYTKA